jgi:hypothetical protein
MSRREGPAASNDFPRRTAVDCRVAGVEERADVVRVHVRQQHPQRGGVVAEHVAQVRVIARLHLRPPDKFREPGQADRKDVPMKVKTEKMYR